MMWTTEHLTTLSDDQLRHAWRDAGDFRDIVETVIADRVPELGVLWRAWNECLDADDRAHNAVERDAMDMIAEPSPATLRMIAVWRQSVRRWVDGDTDRVPDWSR